MKFPSWHVAQENSAAAERLADAGYPYLVSGVLASRGVECAEDAAEFLTQETSLTYSPFLMRDMDKAVERIAQAVAAGERIAIFGDYDVDGITATCIMVDYLKSRGADVVHYIPRRIEDGYGLSRDAIEGLRKGGATLLVTVDCGITGVEEVAFARSIGMDVVVTDHHECKETLPVACAVVDPRRGDCEYPFKHLAGCGVALKLVLALGGPDREEALFSRYCTLAAVGTVADVMQMTGENRTIVSRGLATLDRSDFIGLHALLKEAGLAGREISSVQIGFVLAPRINAAGRMGAADMAADLLLCQDPAKAEELAKALCALNRERQSVEQTIYSQAEAMIGELPEDQRRALVLERIGALQPVGRRQLAARLNLPEREVRTVATLLKEHGLVSLDAAGMSLTQEASDILPMARLFSRELRGLTKLETALSARWNGTKVCVVPGDADQDEHVLHEVGRSAAARLRSFLQSGSTLAVTGGTTIGQVAATLPGGTPMNVMVVPARGGIGRSLETQANTIACEIARRLGVNKSTVSRCLRRARQRLYSRLRFTL